MKPRNNHILIDIGKFGSHFNNHTIGGKDFHIDTTYLTAEYIRRSGKVIEVPTEFTYTMPFNTQHKMRHILVEKDDIVFFDAKAFVYCEEHNLIDKSSEGSTIYLMPYRYLICAIKKDTGKIQMLNGKLLIKMRQDLSDSSVIKQPELKRSENVYKYAEIVSVDNNEGYQGFSYSPNSQYENFEYSRQELKVGDIVVMNKCSEYDLQAVLKEPDNQSELDKSFVINRSDIVCFKSKIEDSFTAYGFYVKLEPTERDYQLSEHIVMSKSKVLKCREGKVLGAGCGVHSCNNGSMIRVKEKSEIEIEGSLYCHNLWVLLK